MNVNFLSNIPDPVIQSLTSKSASAADSSAAGAGGISLSPQSGSVHLSPLAKLLNTLQQLQQSNPDEYTQVTAQIATNLQTAADAATAAGNPTQAAKPKQLATDFINASQNNTLPNIQDLAQAIGGHWRHHHGRPAGQSSDPASDLSKTISAFLVNATSSPQPSSFDPLSIINETLSSAGLT